MLSPIMGRKENFQLLTMKNNLETSLEHLRQDFQNQNYDGKVLKQIVKFQLSRQDLAKIAEISRDAFENLLTQKRELLFAYQTLEIGYRQYWEFFNFAPDGYLVTDIQGNIKEVNQTILSMLSVRREDLLGQNITFLLPDIQHQDTGLQITWFRGSQNMEVLWPRVGQSPFFASINISPQCNDKKETIGLLWLIRDVTEWKQTEEALRKSTTELRLLLEQTPCILFTTDSNLKLISISGTGLNKFKIQPEDAQGSDLTKAFPPQYSLHLRNLEKALAGVPQIAEFEWNGVVFQYIVEARRDNHGTIVGIIGAAFDVTERKKAEKILQRSDQFNSSLLQSSPTPILVINPDTSISYVNPAFEELTGFTTQSTMGLKAPYPWSINSPDNSQKPSTNILKPGKKKKEMHFQKRNGDQFWVQVCSVFIKNNSDPGYYLQTWTDITEEKKLKENMEFYIMQITRVQEEERKRIAQELHEETIQDLAALCLATESIINTQGNNQENAVQDLKILRHSIDKVIDKVRKFSYGLRPGVLDYLGLTAALETLIEELQGKGISSNLTITGSERFLPPDIEITLFRIAQEALSNIKKYSLASKVDIGLKYTQSRIRLKITDNGQGFSLPDRLGELANQGKLGLIGMEERARLIGGSFYIQAQPQKGTTIIVSLPLSNKLKLTPGKT